MHRSNRVFAAACALAGLTMIAGVPPALEHAQWQAGPIHMETGFGTSDRGWMEAAASVLNELASWIAKGPRYSSVPSSSSP